MRRWMGWTALALAASACSGEEFSDYRGSTDASAGGTGGGVAGSSASGGAGALGGASSGGSGGGAGTPSGGDGGGGGSPGGSGGSGGTGASPGGTGGSAGSGGTGASTGAGGGTGGSTGATGGTTTCVPSCSPTPGTSACEGMNISNGWVDNDCQQLSGLPPMPVNQAGTGCSDGTREGFFDTSAFPGIAACAGGWSVPGVKNANGSAKSVTCSRLAGNTSCNPLGTCCSVEDLCASGWHVCANMGEALSRTGSTGCVLSGSTPGFFVIREGMTPGLTPACGSGLYNNLLGCMAGTSPGHAPADPFCTPMNRYWHRWDCCCASVAGWSCNSTTEETLVVIKSTPRFGGVLCCSDG